MMPLMARTWAPRGRTPVVRVRGRSARRVPIAALTCYKPGHRSRLIYRPRRDDRSGPSRKSFAWTDYRDLLRATHIHLDGPIMLVGQPKHPTPTGRRGCAPSSPTTIG